MRPFLAVALVVACSQKLETPDTNTPVPSESDTDTDADADSDVDADSDADSDLECGTPYPTPPPDGNGGVYPECVTQRVFCGETIEATIGGGTTFYDYDFWLQSMSLSTMDPEDTAGEERVYVIEPIFPDGYAVITVESCNPVWASWIATGDLTPYCAEATQAPLGHFYEEQGRFLQEVEVLNASVGEYGVQVIIDSAVGFEGNFLMTVECGTQ